MPGEVFRHIHVAGPEAVNRAIPQADFRLAGQGDNVLPPWGGVLKDDQIYQIGAYLETLAEQEANWRQPAN